MTTPQLTGWIKGNPRSDRPGRYQVRFLRGWPYVWARWDGKQLWDEEFDVPLIDALEHRGLAKKA